MHLLIPLLSIFIGAFKKTAIRVLVSNWIWWHLRLSLSTDVGIRYIELLQMQKPTDNEIHRSSTPDGTKAVLWSHPESVLRLGRLSAASLVLRIPSTRQKQKSKTLPVFLFWVVVDGKCCFYAFKKHSAGWGRMSFKDIKTSFPIIPPRTEVISFCL